jgi:hypothetical protein
MAENTEKKEGTEQKNQPFEIHAVKNGFLVLPARNAFRETACYGWSETHVFQSLEGLIAWLREQYTHRSFRVPHD